jgi:serine protease
VWTVSTVELRDFVGNRNFYSTSDLQALGFPTDLTVTSSGGGDTDPPVLTDFDFNPKSIDVSVENQSVTCGMTATDSGSGTTSAFCTLRSPSGITQQCGTSSPSSGDGFDGTWSCTRVIAASSEAGVWTVSTVELRDFVGNRNFYSTSDLQALGFPSQLDVTYGTP